MNIFFKHPFLSALLKKIWILLALMIILAAIFSSVFRSLTPWAKQYQGEVERRLSKVLAQPVQIQTLETGWYWLQPVIKLNQVTINNGKSSIHIDKVFIGIDILASLWRWQIEPRMLYLDNFHLVLREQQGRLTVDGITKDTHLSQEESLQESKNLLAWLANQDSLIIQRGSLDVYVRNDSHIAVRDLDLSIVRSMGYYKLKGKTRLTQKNTSLFEFSGHLQFDPDRLENTNGQLYFSGKNIDLADWKALIPKASQLFEGGQGDLVLWLDLKKGRVSSLQAQLALQQLAWHFKQNTERLQLLEANLAWKPKDSGWQLQADKVNLRVGNVNWPQNQLSLQFDKERGTYQIFVKSILLESLLSIGIDWPKYVQNIKKMKPQGVLSETQLVFKENQPNLILTRFDNLAWMDKDNKTKVSHLTGVLNWQPEQGRLELDSKNTCVKLKDYPSQELNLLNGAFEWKQLNDGLRISIDRFVLSQKDLTLSAEGVFSEVTKQSLGQVRLNAQFSGNHIEQWIRYIPANYLRPKLDYWLKNNIKSIAKASGKLSIDGDAHEFPFDNNTGEFSILSHIVGGELSISPEWQLITNMEGYIRVKNRNLDIDFIHADFQDVPVSKMNVRIDDIGKNHENVLIHGLVEAKAQNIQNFVMFSPLHDKLWALKLMSLKDMISLNLRLEIPLFDEISPLLVQGEIQFKNNTILFPHPKRKIKLEEVDGPLSFDEKGINQSRLTANLLGLPFNIKIQSKTLTTRTTSVLMDGEFTVESLKKEFNLPIFSLFKGKFFTQSELRLPGDPHDSKTLVIHSNLRGLAIHLPPPLGKTYDDEKDLQVRLDFNAKQDVRLRADYANHLSSDILFQEKNGAIDFYGGQIRLGGEKALAQKKRGIALVGKLDDFDLRTWGGVFSQFTKEDNKSSLIRYLRIINVSLSKLTFLKQSFDNMAIKVHLVDDKTWSLNIKQKNIAGDLTYQPSTNFLSGYMTHLHIEPFETSNKANPKFYPKQIPNLNLRIDNLSFGGKAIGNMTLKSQSTDSKWLIEYARIESPFYLMDVSGEWVKKEKTNKTNLSLHLQIKNLAKSLERWNIIPAVDANKGEMEFKGYWNDSIFNFSFAGLNGNMNLKLKNGAITHLSPETEAKLGLGKLLSILSLQTIPRRLTLDFSDLSQKGFSFDDFQGNFAINKGIMATYDSYLDGPVAFASMRGNLDLVKHLYDLTLKINPHITASLPVVATIAGGPIAGVAAWIANKMITQSMQKISGYSYKVSGPWDEPIVQQLNIIKGN